VVQVYSELVCGDPSVLFVIYLLFHVSPPVGH